MIHPENTRRIKKAQEALAEYVRIAEDTLPTDVEVGVIDLLADLRHFCEWAEIDYYKLDVVADRHHTEERGLNSSSVKDWRPE
jgi:hypothetical protein